MTDQKKSDPSETSSKDKKDDNKKADDKDKKDDNKKADDKDKKDDDKKDDDKKDNDKKDDDKDKKDDDKKADDKDKKDDDKKAGKSDGKKSDALKSAASGVKKPGNPKKSAFTPPTPGEIAKKKLKQIQMIAYGVVVVIVIVVLIVILSMMSSKNKKGSAKKRLPDRIVSVSDVPGQEHMKDPTVDPEVREMKKDFQAIRNDPEFKKKPEQMERRAAIDNLEYRMERLQDFLDKHPDKTEETEYKQVDSLLRRIKALREMY